MSLSMPTGARRAEQTASPAVRVELADRFLSRRLTLIWGLLFFNGLGTIGASFFRIPRPVAQVFTMTALALALLLALCLNRRVVIRPNLFMGLVTLLVIAAAMTSIRGLAGAGGVFRSLRLFCYVLVLWLLTPWWGRRDLLLARCHLRAVVGVSALVILGLVVAPGRALGGGGGGRLVGVLWPIPAPQVAEYAALAAGMALVLWLSGALRRGPALSVFAVGAALLLGSQTRTAMIGLVTGLLAAGLTSFAFQRRFRRVALLCLALLPFGIVVLGPTMYAWFTRDQSTEQLAGLTGRKKVWDALVAAPRPEFNRWFGFGLSDKSFNGLSIDSTWLAAYHEQGLVAVAIIAAIFTFLVVIPAFTPPGPARALATFLAVYCLAASYTEVTIGDASNYLLALVAAASMVTARTTRPVGDGRATSGGGNARDPVAGSGT